MKYFLLVIASITIFGFNSYSQCTPAIPANAIVVTSYDTINGGFDPIWVCSGDSLHTDGGFHNIFLETGAFMSTGGGIDTIYIKAGATLSMNGGIHVIYYVDTASLLSIGGIPTLDSCENLFFDYSNAPVNGCSVVFTSASFQSTDTSICVESTADFSNLSLNDSVSQWFFEGGNPPSSLDENPQNIFYDTPGSYDVTLIVNNENNIDTLTLTDYITVHPLPAPPILTQSNDTVFATQGFATYEWVFEDTVLSATTYFIVPTQNGDYHVFVTDVNGCEATAEIVFEFVSIKSIDNNQLWIFPNPADNNFTIKINEALKNAHVEIDNVLGQTIYAGQLSKQNSTQISLDVPSGIYFVKVFDEQSLFTKRLIIK